MSVKFEELIEHVIAGNEAKARKLFHAIVVEKSRKIYEDLEVEDAFDDVDADRNGVEDDENSDEEIGGDAADDLQTDVFTDGDDIDDDDDVEDEVSITDADENAEDDDDDDDDEDDDDNDDELNPDIDDRVSDLESELEKLEAQFDELHDAEEEEEDEDNEEEHEDIDDLEDDAAESDNGEVPSADVEDIHDLEEEEPDEDEETSEEAEDDDLDGLGLSDDEDEPVDESLLREYVLRVTDGIADSTEKPFVNTKSPAAGKNDIVKGVSGHNLNQGGVSTGRPTPKSEELTKDEIQNRAGKKKVSLKSAPKAVDKEQVSVNTKSVES